MALTILNVAYPLVPVGRDIAGGAEQILSCLDRGIQEAGFTSLVVAAEGSATHGRLIPSPDYRGLIDDAIRRRAAQEHSRLISEALTRLPIDVIHLHGFDFIDYLPREDVPCLVTLHLPPAWYPARVFELDRPNLWFNCVSEAQLSQCPPCRAPLRLIPNGTDDYGQADESVRGNYVVTMGRVCPEKGLHLAIAAANRAAVPLVVAGQVHPYAYHQTYFREALRPHLSADVRFVGPLGLQDRRRLLAKARCLLVPSTVAETSSLVAMEALAAGTPVIALRSGALPEIVDHGVTGFLVEDVEQMAFAIFAAGMLLPENCRIAARTRFSASRMVGEYLTTYREMTRISSL